MTRAKTQGPGKPRAPTHSGGKTKRAATAVPFNELEAAIDALDSDDDVRRPTAADTPRTRSDERRATLPEPSRTTTRKVPPGPPPGRRAAPSTAPPSSEPSDASPKPRTAPPGPPPGKVPFPVRSPVAPSRPAPARADSNEYEVSLEALEDAINPTDGAVRKRFDSRDSSGVRALSVGDTAADDFVVDVEELPEIRALAIAIYDDPPQIASAKQAIGVVGHKVVAAAGGSTGVEQIKSLLRSGSADVLLVGVPGGEELIDTALALAPRRPVVIASCSGTAIEAVRRAASVGADLAVARPIDAERLAPVLLAAARLTAERHNTTNARGSETMLRARLDALVEPEPGALQPFELFQRVLELELKRSRRYGYPIAVALFAVEIAPPEPPPGVRGILRARAGNALIHAVRDIDMATEVDQERFLVLLPYTTLAGAAEVARRIIGAVTGGDPVVASGRTFPPKIIGAVAGAQVGQPLSFSRLMRDATQALEQARRDGAELAVPMARGDQ